MECQTRTLSGWIFRSVLRWIALFVQSDAPEWKLPDYNSKRIASAGWAILAYYAGLNQDEYLNAYSQLLDEVAIEIHTSQNRVWYSMNGFVIATGTYIKELTDKSKLISPQIGLNFVL